MHDSDKQKFVFELSKIIENWPPKFNIVQKNRIFKKDGKFYFNK
jgi:hypothetical protein